MKKSLGHHRVFIVDDDINEAKTVDMLNNEVPSLNSHPSPSPNPNLVVGSPSRTRGMKTPTVRPIVRGQATSTPPRYSSASPQRYGISTTPQRPIIREPKYFNNNNNMVLSMDRMSLMDQNHGAEQFDHSMLSTKEYHAKMGRMNDVHKERQDCPLIAEVIDNELGVLETIHLLHSSPPKSTLLFMKSQAGSKNIRDMMAANSEVRQKIADFVIQKHMVNELALSPMGNFIVQKMPGIREDIDKQLCIQLAEDMIKLTMSKYGCRVVQTVITVVRPEHVKKLIVALRGYELDACLDLNGTHVIQILLGQRYQVYEDFFNPIANREILRDLVEHKLGCRIIQSCLDSLSKEITSSYVPPLLNKLIIPLLVDAKRYTENEFANYVIQNIIKNPSFSRQRDFIIDQVLLGNLLRLSQGKFSSHVVEAALDKACKDRLGRMCREIFHDYKIIEKGRTPLEVLLFDQYGNYIMQKLLLIAIAVCKGLREGEQNWMSILTQAVIRNRERLSRYSSGKKILALLYEHQSGVFGSAPSHRYR